MTGVHDARLVPAGLAAWAASWSVSAGLAWAQVAGIAGVLIAAAVCLARGRRAGAMVALPALAALVASGVAASERSAAMCDAQSLSAAGTLVAEVVVEDEPRPLAGGQQRWIAPARVTAWDAGAGGASADTPGQERCDVRAGAALAVVVEREVDRGARLLVQGDPSARDGAEAVMWRARVLEEREASSLLQWRRAFDGAVSAVDPQVAGLVEGMVTGDTTRMPAAQVDQMRTAGLAHLTAVSGAHFAILIVAIGFVMTASRAPRLVRAGAVALAAGGFAAIVGPEASVMRALTMASAVALGLAWGRPARGLPALATGVLVLSIACPRIVTSLGFAMSVAAVTAIVLWAPVIARALSRVLPPGLARVASVPLVAQAAVTPLVLIMEPGLILYAVPANLLAGLAVPAVMGLGAAALILSPCAPGIAAAFAHGAGLAARPIAWVAEAASEAPGARVPWLGGAWGVALAALVLAGAIVATVARGGRAVRLVLSVATGAALLGGILAGGAGAGPALADWDVIACDVGQGDMMLLRAGPSSAVVIDTGPDDDLAQACLRAHGIDHVPLLILTHPHADHDGAVAGVLAAAAVDAAWASQAGQGGGAATALDAADVQVEVPAAGRSAQLGSARVEVLSALHAEPSAEANDASVVVLAQADGTSVLALGDLEEAGQVALLARLGAAVSVDVVKVPHHGSAVQVAALASRIDAAVALVSVGEGNTYGHPTDAALSLYGAGRALLRTDLCGAVGVASDSEGLRWTSCLTDVAR